MGERRSFSARRTTRPCPATSWSSERTPRTAAWSWRRRAQASFVRVTQTSSFRRIRVTSRCFACSRLPLFFLQQGRGFPYACGPLPLYFTGQWMRLLTADCIAVGPCNAENVLGSIPLLRAAFSPQEAALFLGHVTVRLFAESRPPLLLLMF